MNSLYGEKGKILAIFLRHSFSDEIFASQTGVKLAFRTWAFGIPKQKATSSALHKFLWAKPNLGVCIESNFVSQIPGDQEPLEESGRQIAFQTVPVSTDIPLPLPPRTHTPIFPTSVNLPSVAHMALSLKGKEADETTGGKRQGW